MAWRRIHSRRARARNQNDRENRSFLLQDFLDGRFRNQNLQLSDITTHVCAFARDRDGSKFLQSKLADATLLQKSSVYCELQPNLFALLVDQFANYVVQMYVKFGTPSQRIEILLLIQSNFVQLCHHQYGCRVVQQAIEAFVLHEESVIVQQLCNGRTLFELAQQPHSNHVVQAAFRLATVAVQVIDFISIVCFTSNLISYGN